MCSYARGTLTLPLLAAAGTDEERGMKKWKAQLKPEKDENDVVTTDARCYDLPVGMPFFRVYVFSFNFCALPFL